MWVFYKSFVGIVLYLCVKRILTLCVHFQNLVSLTDDLLSTNATWIDLPKVSFLAVIVILPLQNSLSKSLLYILLLPKQHHILCPKAYVFNCRSYFYYPLMLFCFRIYHIYFKYSESTLTGKTSKECWWYFEKCRVDGKSVQFIIIFIV